MFSAALVIALFSDHCDAVDLFHEGYCVCRRSERDSVELRTRSPYANSQLSNADIRPGRRFDRLDRPDNIAGIVGIFVEESEHNTSRASEE